MTLNNFEKSNYIKNNFHQSFLLGLNTNIRTTETVNLVIPIDDLTKAEKVSNTFHHDVYYPEDYSVKTILDKYEDTGYEKEVSCFFVRAIDGDTFVVSIPYEDENNNVFYTEKRIRLVGVNTPEKNKQGADVSKLFLEKACSLGDRIYLNIDNNKEVDNYGRTLAVLIVNNKNINEVMLKEGLAEVMYIPPSEFNPYDWADINTSFSVYNFQNDDINILSPYFNPEMTNIVFTPKNDYDTIYPYEVYKGVIYVRLKPFSQNIVMHILPKIYDCSSNILIFKDSMIKNKNINITDDYRSYKERDFINSYYQENGEDRNRLNPDLSNEQYNPSSWTNTFCDFSYNISKSTKHFNNLEIHSGYRYNQSTPFYSIHYTGVRDNTSFTIEDRCSLVDANYDSIEEAGTNNITQFHYDSNNKLYIPKENGQRDIKTTYANINHLFNKDENDEYIVGQLHRKTLKYINDILYVEEDIRGETDNDIRHGMASWVDLSEEE